LCRSIRLRGPKLYVNPAIITFCYITDYQTVPRMLWKYILKMRRNPFV
jgi:hypothetical protein